MLRIQSDEGLHLGRPAPQSNLPPCGEIAAARGASCRGLCSDAFPRGEKRSLHRKPLRFHLIACRRHDAHQFGMADLGHLLRRGFFGSCSASTTNQPHNHSRRSAARLRRNRASRPRNGEGAKRTASRKDCFERSRTIHDRRRMSLHMHMVDAGMVVVDGAQHVAAGKGKMAGIHQERDARPNTS